MFKINLEEAEINIVLQALGQLPFVKSSGLINNITTQANEQMAEQEKEEE